MQTPRYEGKRVRLPLRPPRRELRTRITNLPPKAPKVQASRAPQRRTHTHDTRPGPSQHTFLTGTYIGVGPVVLTDRRGITIIHVPTDLPAIPALHCRLLLAGAGRVLCASGTSRAAARRLRTLGHRSYRLLPSRLLPLLLLLIPSSARVAPPASSGRRCRFAVPTLGSPQPCGLQGGETEHSRLLHVRPRAVVVRFARSPARSRSRALAPPPTRQRQCLLGLSDAYP